MEPKTLEKINYLGKNSGVGKKAALCTLTDNISFRAKHIRNIIIKQYADYMINYLNYDKVYILGPTKDQVNVTNILGVYKDHIIWGNEDDYWMKKLNFDDLFITQMTCTFFGGGIQDSYFRQAINVFNWYDDTKKVFLIQDDPIYTVNNPIKMIDHRMFDLKNLRVRYDDTSKFEPYQKISDKLSDILDNCITAYCGSDYQLFYDKIMALKHQYIGLPPTNTKWDNFECYYYQGMNDNLENKLRDFPYSFKKYDSEYHGYVKGKDRIKLTESYYKALSTKFMSISQKDEFFKDIPHDFIPGMDYYALLQYIAENSKSTLILADTITFNTFVSPRWFDSMLSDFVAFVYTPYDSEKKLVDDDFLKEFMYVDTPEQFAERVKAISEDEELYKKVKYLQRLTTYRMFGKFCTDENKKIFEKKLGLA